MQPCRYEAKIIRMTKLENNWQQIAHGKKSGKVITGQEQIELLYDDQKGGELPFSPFLITSFSCEHLALIYLSFSRPKITQFWQIDLIARQDKMLQFLCIYFFNFGCGIFCFRSKRPRIRLPPRPRSTSSLLSFSFHLQDLINCAE